MGGWLGGWLGGRGGGIGIKAKLRPAGAGAWPELGKNGDGLESFHKICEESDLRFRSHENYLNYKRGH